MNNQVQSKHYRFEKYCEEERFSSYWHQLKEILNTRSDSVLEIGIGDKVFGSYLKNNTTIKYTSVDAAGDLSPDYVADVTKLPFVDQSFDAVCAFEILEHLPFEKFITSLKEIGRVSKKNVIISLPHWGRHFSFKIRLPFIKMIKFQYKINFLPIKHSFNGEHYWEIGKKDYKIKRIRETINNSGLKIVKDYVAFDSPYHHFFVLEKV